jgi:hypothetical protein
MKATSSKKVTNSDPSTVKSNLQKLQAVKKQKVTKSEKGQQKQPAITVKQPPTTVFFLWSNNLQPASLRA